MSTLFSSLNTSGNSLGVLQEALNVIQNNISNASTPGYATQGLSLESQPLQLLGGLAGGVAAGGLENSRDDFAEESVQRQVQLQGFYEQQSTSVGSLESLFDVSGKTGVPASLSQLFQSFSAWSANPSDLTARQNVLSSAGTLADDVRGLAGQLAASSHGIDKQIQTTVSSINDLANTLAQYNADRMGAAQADPGEDAKLYASLEQLSQYTDFTALKQPDGTVTVLLGGQTPLVVGKQAFSISADSAIPAVPPPVNPAAPPSARILDSQGKEITAQIAGGELGGLLDVRNRVLGSMLGDAYQQGSLNQFAQGLADTVNQIQGAGTVSQLPGAPTGVPVFTYSQADPTAVAASLNLNSEITPQDLAAVDAAGNVNGNAIRLANLGSSTSPDGNINGLTLNGFFSRIMSTVGQESASAKDNSQNQAQVAAQAHSLRDQASGVSLDDQAVHLLEFQRSYEAAAKMISVLKDLTETAINIIP
ncbi:MAG: flagellar hook-associated protein FlgK [Bryobacteraceae bacterium]